MRGHVATEQEKVLTAREADLEEVQVTVRELTESLEIEKAKRLENGTEVTRLQLALADAKKTIENNENSKSLRVRLIHLMLFVKYRTGFLLSADLYEVRGFPVPFRPKWLSGQSVVQLFTARIEFICINMILRLWYPVKNNEVYNMIAKQYVAI